MFLTIGGQMVSATENALINTLETPLLPGMCGRAIELGLRLWRT